MLIGTDLKNSEEEKIYSDHSIIESDKILKGENVYFTSNCFAEFDGFLGKIKV